MTLEKTTGVSQRGTSQDEGQACCHKQTCSAVALAFRYFEMTHTRLPCPSFDVVFPLL